MIMNGKTEKCTEIDLRGIFLVKPICQEVSKINGKG